MANNNNERPMDFKNIDTGLLKFCLQHGFVGQQTQLPQRDPNVFVVLFVLISILICTHKKT